MNIAIDISSLQTGHRMRGIGFTVINFINNISESSRKKHRFVLYLHEKESQEALELLSLEGMDYDVRYLEPTEAASNAPSSRLRRLLGSSLRQSRELKVRFFGDNRIGNVNGLDVFIQPDQSGGLPKNSKIKKILVIYDIIPYVLESDYLWSYKTARLRGFPRKSALRCAVRRQLYIKKLKLVARRANLLLAISKSTKDDFVKYANLKPAKIQVIHLGVSEIGQSAKPSPKEIRRYYETSWGYSPKPYELDLKTPFILYVGGADPRRKIDELVEAFNYLRAQGIELKLVLAGDTLQGANQIPTPAINYALKNSSYLEDIIFMGFVTDSVREYLYQNALAFVYPSTYEGFGLPVLEAMRYGTPVITYKNSSIREVAENSVIYANDYLGLADAIKQLSADANMRSKYIKLGPTQASKFSWKKTSDQILEAISS